MKLFHTFFAGICLLVLAGLDVRAQESSRFQVDPGVSLDNYKHPNKAAQAKKTEPLVRQRTRPRVGIVRRSSVSPMPKEFHQMPRYARSSGWTFFKKSQPSPSVINPLANPSHYKVN